MIDIKNKIISVLKEALPELSLLNDDFYLIGAAALILSDVKLNHTSDIDILTSDDDAETLKHLWMDRRIEIHDLKNSELFRSNFSRYKFMHVDIEIMGSLEVKKEDAWIPLKIHDYNIFSVDFMQFKIPTLEEQKRILQWFGRDKDLDKIEFYLRDFS
jgi:hypothetical protein